MTPKTGIAKLKGSNAKKPKAGLPVAAKWDRSGLVPATSRRSVRSSAIANIYAVSSSLCMVAAGVKVVQCGSLLVLGHRGPALVGTLRSTGIHRRMPRASRHGAQHRAGRSFRAALLRAERPVICRLVRVINRDGWNPGRGDRPCLPNKTGRAGWRGDASSQDRYGRWHDGLWSLRSRHCQLMLDDASPFFVAGTR